MNEPAERVEGLAQGPQQVPPDRTGEILEAIRLMAEREDTFYRRWAPGGQQPPAPP